jgi:hypothetical protein
MAKIDVAVVDTSVIVLLVGTPPAPVPKEFPLRQSCARHCLQSLNEDGVNLVLPAPVIAELCRDGPGDALAASVMAHFGGLRIEPFGLPAALATGKMLGPALKARLPSDGKAAMKYDAMIAGVAHALGAKYLVTANARDFAAHIVAAGSSVQIVEADKPRSGGQLVLFPGGKTGA